MPSKDDIARLRSLAEDLVRLEQEYPRAILTEVEASVTEPAFMYLWPESPGVYDALRSAAGRLRSLLVPFGIEIPSGRHSWEGAAEWFVASRPVHAEGNVRESLAGIFGEMAAAVREIIAINDISVRSPKTGGPGRREKVDRNEPAKKVWIDNGRPTPAVLLRKCTEAGITDLTRRSCEYLIDKWKKRSRTPSKINSLKGVKKRT